MNRKSSFSSDRRYRFDKGVCEGSGTAPVIGPKPKSLPRCAVCNRFQFNVRKDGTSRKHLRIVQTVEVWSGRVLDPND